MENNEGHTRKLLHIKEVSRLYGVPAPTLRFWEKKGLISSVRDKENNYRLFKPSCMMVELGDTVFYRNMDIPFRQVMEMKNMDCDKLAKTLADAQVALKEKIAEFRLKEVALERKLKFIEEIKAASEGELIESDIPFEKVIELDYSNKEHFKRYLSDPSCFVSVNNSLFSDSLEDINGIAVEADYAGNIIFQKNQNDKYLMSYFKNPLYDYTYDNFAALKSKLKDKNLTSSQQVFQFLINMVDENGISCDYYKVWFKID